MEAKNVQPETDHSKISITNPLRVEHKLHVDQDLNWTDANSLQLLNKIGEGAYGTVYRAKHIPTNSILAIKTVPISRDSDTSTEITKEIEILKLCRHNNIVSLYGCAFVDDSLWVGRIICHIELKIITDFCAFGSVKDFMKHSPRKFTEVEIAAILYEVLQGLIYLHSISIVHRDLKSANILLTDDGVYAKIADFGLSYQVSNTLAKQNSVVGTPLFMAPEALELTDYSSKADIWSLAITAIEMWDGCPPHNDEPVMRAMLLITQSKSPTLSDPSSASPEFNDFLSICLKKDPKERPTAEELLKHPFVADINRTKVLHALLSEYDDWLKSQEETKLAKPASLSPKSSRKLTWAVTDFDKTNGDDASLDITSAVHAMQQLKESIIEQTEIEKIFAEEVESYATMSYNQLVSEIREMKQRLLNLENGKY